MQREPCKFTPSRPGKLPAVPETGYRVVATEEEFAETMCDGGTGFCIGCGAETSGVEPDACGYRCSDCGMPYVYGLEELLLMGLVRIGEVTV